MVGYLRDNGPSRTAEVAKGVGHGHVADERAAARADRPGPRHRERRDKRAALPDFGLRGMAILALEC